MATHTDQVGEKRSHDGDCEGVPSPKKPTPGGFRVEVQLTHPDDEADPTASAAPWQPILKVDTREAAETAMFGAQAFHVLDLFKGDSAAMMAALGTPGAPPAHAASLDLRCPDGGDNDAGDVGKIRRLEATAASVAASYEDMIKFASINGDEATLVRFRIVESA